MNFSHLMNSLKLPAVTLSATLVISMWVVRGSQSQVESTLGTSSISQESAGGATANVIDRSQDATKEQDLVKMVSRCPFSTGQSVVQCRNVIRELHTSTDLHSPWQFVKMSGKSGGTSLDDELKLNQLWETEVREMGLWLVYQESREKEASEFDRGDRRIAGRLSFRFVKDSLREVIFQEGTPNLMLGIPRIIVPGPFDSLRPHRHNDDSR